MGNPYINRAKKYGVPYEEGLSRLTVLNRAGWRCQMPTCLYGDRTIDPSVPGRVDGRIPDHRGTIDHIQPLGTPGSPGHVSKNVRAAHRLCNREEFSRSKRPPLLGLKEIAVLLGEGDASVRTIVKEIGFPAPIVQLPTGPVWDRNDVKAWKKGRGAG